MRWFYHCILDSGRLEVGEEPLQDLVLGALAVQIERILLHVVNSLKRNGLKISPQAGFF
jgi:hypothetical protein